MDSCDRRAPDDVAEGNAVIAEELIPEAQALRAARLAAMKAAAGKRREDFEKARATEAHEMADTQATKEEPAGK